jgi:hypothetical protein
MHNLSLCARCNETQLCNAATDQCDTRSVWRALYKRAQKREALRRSGECIRIIDNES